MSKIEKDVEFLLINFQWTIGDTRLLEKNLVELVRKPETYYLVSLISRIVALGLIFLASYMVLPNVSFWKVLTISIAATSSLWASWFMVSVSMNTLEKLAAKDPKMVGWNEVRIDNTGIIWDDETSQDYSSWQGISDIVLNQNSIWFKTGTFHGYFIPSRVFESTKQFDECVELIKSFKENATLPAHKHPIEAPKVLH